MPDPIHAVLVTRTTPASAASLERALAAIHAQTRPVDALTIVVCGDVERVHDVVADSGAEWIVSARASTPFAEAVHIALRRVDDTSALWLLRDDCEPAPEALAALAAALERGPSLAIAAPKLVDSADTERIVSLGQTMTRYGRSIEMAADEFDQGQFDATDDVLGADVRGMLVRADAVRALVPDVALRGADEGLDMGVRAHLAGRRVALVPSARLLVPARTKRKRVRESFRARTAQLHRRLVYAKAWALPLHWLSLLPIALWRTVLRLIAKDPALVPGEWGAALVAMFRPGAVVRSRRRIRRSRTASWVHVEALRADTDFLREQRSQEAGSAKRGELRFFSGGGGWTVLGALVVSVVAFLALLTWKGVGGGALLPLSTTVRALWANARYGLPAEGLDGAAAADPFSGVVAVLGSLSPANPSFALLVLWLLALPLAVLGGWFAATRVTDRSGYRILVAVLWGASPSLLAALVDPRPAAVLAHLLLPWLLYAGAAAHRSWGSSASASIVFAAIVACAPSLAVPLVVIWALGLVLTIAFHPRGIARIIWTVIPAACLAAPIVFAQLKRGRIWGLLADPGLPWASAGASRADVLLGFPTPDAAGASEFLARIGLDLPVWWLPLLLAPVAVLAVLAPLTRRWRLGIGLVVLAVAGLASAYAFSGIQVQTAGADPVGVWAGPALGLAWLGAVLAAAVTLDVGPAPRPAKGIVAVAAGTAVVLTAVPSLLAVHLGTSELHEASGSTLPAIVAAGTASEGTLLLEPQPDGSLVAQVVWGESETLDGQSTLRSTGSTATDGERAIAQLATDLVSGSATDAPGDLAAKGIAFVLLADGTDAGHELQLSASGAIDQRAGMVRVGHTDRGDLWRVSTEVTPRTDLARSAQAVARTIWLIQLGAIIVALLLAVPTPASIRDGRRRTRVIGGGFEEER
ncbi:MAG: glycosyltransferase [Microbacterium sp.]